MRIEKLARILRVALFAALAFQIVGAVLMLSHGAPLLETWHYFAGAVAFAVLPSRFRYQRLASKQYPVAGALGTHVAQDVRFNLKELVPSDVISGMFVRVVGNITKAGAGPGAATGRENPEALVMEVNCKQSPTWGGVSKVALTARASIVQGLFDRGFSIRETDVTDAAAVVAVDFSIPIRFEEFKAAAPAEFALPMAFLDEYQIIVKCGGREQLFTGGANTWDLTALNVELWVLVEQDVALAAFHLVEEYEEVISIVATKRDLAVDLASGYVYHSVLLLAERDQVVDDALINDIGFDSGGRVWFPVGSSNAVMIRRANREMVLPSETLTGIYYLPLLKSGMISRAPDALQNKLRLLLDVTLGGGAVRNVTMRARRIKPHFLRVAA